MKKKSDIVTGKLAMSSRNTHPHEAKIDKKKLWTKKNCVLFWPVHRFPTCNTPVHTSLVIAAYGYERLSDIASAHSHNHSQVFRMFPRNWTVTSQNPWTVFPVHASADINIPGGSPLYMLNRLKPCRRTCFS